MIFVRLLLISAKYIRSVAHLDHYVLSTVIAKKLHFTRTFDLISLYINKKHFKKSHFQ